MNRAFALLGWEGVSALFFFLSWFVITVPHQFSGKYGDWVRRRNYFGLIPGWTFFAPVPGTTDYRFVYRDIAGNGYGAWREVAWCAPRRLADLLWHPRRHRTKLVVDCISALSRTLQELRKHGIEPERQPETWMTSVPYLALLNVALHGCVASGVAARQLAIVEQYPSEPERAPKLFILSPPHDLD